MGQKAECKHDWEEIDDWVENIPTEDELKDDRWAQVKYVTKYRCRKCKTEKIEYEWSLL